MKPQKRCVATPRAEFRAVTFSELPANLGLPSIHSGYWDPFFGACEETSSVICMHIGSSSRMMKTSDDAGETVRVANHYVSSSLALSDWLMSGLLVKFPNSRIAFSGKGRPAGFPTSSAAWTACGRRTTPP